MERKNFGGMAVSKKDSVLLSVDGISLSFGGVKALQEVSVEVGQGEIFGIIGPNGSGKTSLFNVITGIYKPDKGKVFFDGEDITGLPPWKIARMGIARTFQNIKLFGYMTCLDNILLGRHIFMRPGVWRTVFALDASDYSKNRHEVEKIIDFLDLKAWRYSLARDIPLGVRKKVELARALAQEPKLLLLDEPTAGLTHEEKSEFLYYIKEINEKFGITIVVIEHDVKVISSVARRVMALDYGVKIAEGPPNEVLSNPDVVKAYMGE